MSAEESKAIVRRAFLAINEGDVDAASEFSAPQLIRNGEPVGRDADKRRDRALRTAFPDLHYGTEDLVAEGSKVAIRWRMTGTHRGDLVSPTMTLSATGKRIDLWGLTIYRIEARTIEEIWESFDMTEFLRQLGVDGS